MALNIEWLLNIKSHVCPTHSTYIFPHEIYASSILTLHIILLNFSNLHSTHWHALICPRSGLAHKHVQYSLNFEG